MAIKMETEKVAKFCYIGDMLDANAGCDSPVKARVTAAWNKFSEYLPISIGKRYSLKLKHTVYTRTSFMRGSS